MLLHNARVLAPDGIYEWIWWDGSRIRDIGNGTFPTMKLNFDEMFDAGGRWVLPGFIDIHVHGSNGFDVMDATPEAVYGMADFFAAHGVTGWLPTTLTHKHDALMAALTNVRDCRDHQGEYNPHGARILGARLEGPYLNVEKAGAQNPQYIRPPSYEEAAKFLDVGVIRILDVAPEVEGADWLIELCRQRGVVTSAAHTNATAAQLLHAHELGLQHSTHTFNAQPALNHRAPGTTGAVLATDTMTAEVICDGVHVDALVVKIVARCKGDHAIIITDAVRPAGLAEGEYDFDERTVLLKDGAIRLPSGTLAGSSLTFDRGVRNYCAFLGGGEAGLRAASHAASTAPAALIGLGDVKGTLEKGKYADFAVVDDDFQVSMTVVEGRVVGK
ncbi:MAG: N-acetylglucosamine-6-phosphate deacetylase [Anaerolineae bacterium]